MIYLFIDYRYHSISDKATLLDAICSHQFHHGTLNKRIYTALDPDKGFALSQWFMKEFPCGCSHGMMFKHERGVKNPEPIPSFDDLLWQVIEAESPPI